MLLRLIRITEGMNMSYPEDIGIKLVCPACRTDVVRVGESYVCTSAECRRRYAIVDGIPKFLVEDAEELSLDAWRELLEHRKSEDS